MNSKCFIYLGLLLAVVLLTSAHVAAIGEETKKTSGLEESKSPEGGFNGGGGGGGSGGVVTCPRGHCCGPRVGGFNHACPCCPAANHAPAEVDGKTLPRNLNCITENPFCKS